ncbi:hypothetical protein H920_17289 [Fukomys damarensis]|uniref:Uncharacterized protein n=1 Tax=Fukomys damarensis TaxID=885580 RepID=A0A091CUM6_FUKDA|nr:hypothetical protein H920_17289 [Fukomys damarensis]
MSTTRLEHKLTVIKYSVTWGGHAVARRLSPLPEPKRGIEVVQVHLPAAAGDQIRADEEPSDIP